MPDADSSAYTGATRAHTHGITVEHEMNSNASVALAALSAADVTTTATPSSPWTTSDDDEAPPVSTSTAVILLPPASPKAATAAASATPLLPSLRSRDAASLAILLDAQLAQVHSDTLARRIDGIAAMAGLVAAIRKEESDAATADRARWKHQLQLHARQQHWSHAPPRVTQLTLSTQRSLFGEFVEEEPAEEQSDAAAAAAATAAAAAESVAAAAPPPEYVPSAALCDCRATSAVVLSWLQSHSLLEVLMGPNSHEEILRRASPVLAFLQAHDALPFPTLLALWTGAAGQHENYVRVTYGLVADLLAELGVLELHTLFQHVTAPLYVGASSGSGGVGGAAAAAAAAPAASELYLQFLKTFTVGAVKRITALWHEFNVWQLRHMNSAEDSLTATEDLPDAHRPPPLDAFNRSADEGSAPIFAVQCFIDLLRSSAGEGNDHGSATCTPLSSELMTLVATQLLPQTLASFPKFPVVRSDGSEAVVVESSMGVARRVLHSCIEMLQQQPYDPHACLIVLRAVDGVLGYFPKEPASGLSFNSSFGSNSPLKHSREEIIKAVVRPLCNPIDMCMSLLSRHCEFAHGVKLSNPSSVLSNGDIQLPSASSGASGDSESLLHSTLLKTIFDTFAPIIACDPRGDLSMARLQTMWALLVGPLSPDVEGAQPDRPVSPLDASILCYFLYRLVDADARNFAQRALAVSRPSNLFSSQYPPPSSLMSSGSNFRDAVYGGNVQRDNGPPNVFANQSADALFPNAASSTSIEDDLAVEDVSDEESGGGSGRSAAAAQPAAHMTPRTVELLLTQIIFRSREFFRSPSRTTKQLAGASASSFAAAVTPLFCSHSQGHESVQFLLVRHLFFFVNELAGTCAPTQFMPQVKLERTDGNLVGIDQLWDLCTGAGPVHAAPEPSSSPSAASPASVSPCDPILPSLQRELHTLLLDLHSSSYLSGALMTSSSGSASSSSEGRRALIEAFLRRIMERVGAIVEGLEKERSAPSLQAESALPQRLLQTLQLLHEFFEIDTKQYAAPRSVSAFSVSTTSSATVMATALFADKYYDQLFDVLQKCTNESGGHAPQQNQGGGRLLGSAHKGPITDLLFRLLMRLPQQEGSGFASRIIDFRFSTPAAAAAGAATVAGESSPPSPAAWEELFSSSSLMSLLFSLQVTHNHLTRRCPAGTDAFVHRVSIDSWREQFLHLGGLRHLVNIFCSMDIDQMSIFQQQQQQPAAAAPVASSPSSPDDAGAAFPSPSPSSSSDNVLSRRCVSLLLDFFGLFLAKYDEHVWAGAYTHPDAKARHILDVALYARQLKKIIAGCIGASQSGAPSATATAVAADAAPASASFSRGASALQVAVDGFSAAVGLVSPSPSPTAPLTSFTRASSLIAPTAAPPAASAGAVATEDNKSILLDALNLYNSLVVGCAAIALPCESVAAAATTMPPGDEEASAGSQLVSVHYDPELLDESFWRTLLLEGLLHNPSQSLRNCVSTSLDTLLELFSEHRAEHPRPLRWFFITLLQRIVLEEGDAAAIDWMRAPVDGDRDPLCVLLSLMGNVLHQEVSMLEATADHTDPVFPIGHSDASFNPLQLAMGVLRRAEERPVHEGASAMRLLTSDNQISDSVLTALLLIARDCVEIVQYQGADVWRRKGGAPCAEIQSQLAARWLQPLFAMLHQLPEPPVLDRLALGPAAAATQQPPKAKSYQAREACANLLKSLAWRNYSILATLVSLYSDWNESYLKGDPRANCKEWEFRLPQEDSSSGFSSSSSSAFGFSLSSASSSAVPVPYLGIKNLGNTCYISALIQQLFMIPSVRSSLQRVQLPQSDSKQSVVLQLQEIILALLPGTALSRTPASTEGFCRSFKDWDGQPINPAIQDDSGIFFTRLVDKINEELAGTPHAGALKSNLCGSVCNQLIGTDPAQCAHSKSSLEAFSALQLEVQNKRTLSQSLQAYVEGEVMQGANAYRCSACNAKVSTLRRTVLARLPPTLCLVLKRFEMCYQTMTTNKINDRLEFPTELDMFPYTLEGLQRRERGGRGAAASAATAATGDGVRSSPLPAGASSASSSSATAAAADLVPLRAPEYYRYVLRGVVVHQGHVAGGHYYSYIQDRSAAPGSSSGWFEFNDKRVSAFDFAREVDEECYGGGKESSWSGSAKSRSAYILFYDRVRSDVVQGGKQCEWKASMAAAAMAALFLMRIKGKYAKTRALLNPGGSGGSNDSSATVQSNQLQVIHQQYAQQVQHLSDLMAFHPASSLTFHLELMRDCKLGLRFATESVWRRSGDPLAEVNVAHVASYAIKHFLHVFVRSYTHDKLMQPWVQLLRSLFEPRDERQLASFPFAHVLPLASWLIDYMCFVKPEQAKAAATAAAAAAQAPSADEHKDSGKAAASSSSSSGSSSALSARGTAVSQDDMPMHGPAPRGAVSSSTSSRHQRSHSGNMLSWEETGGADSDGDGDGFAHTLPPFDAPPSLLFGYLISCPESDVREGVSEVLCAAATITCKYQLASRERELAPSLCTLVDHLTACVPFLPFYASKSLALYLKLVHKLCSASQLILARFLASGADGVSGAETGDDAVAPRNDLLSRLLDLYLGGVLPEDNPCGNRINGMALSSARLRRYYPLTKEAVYSSASVWQRPFWLLINLLVTHSDPAPLRAVPTATPTSPPSSSDSNSAAECASDLRDVELKDAEPAAQSAEASALSETADAASAPPSAPVSRRHSADTSGDDVPDAPAIPLSANAVSLLRFPPLLHMMVSDSAVSARMIPIAELVVKLATDNLSFSQSLARVLFAHIENAGAVTASYTLLRLLLRLNDSVAHARRLFILERWVELLAAEQMYWNPMDSSLNYLFTLLTSSTGGQALVELMHEHVERWRWLIDWISNNKTAPLPYSASDSGVQLEKPSRTRGGAGAASSSSLQDSWRNGSSWKSPSFNTERLGNLRMAADDSGADSAADLMGVSDDESTEVSTVEEYDEREEEARRTRKIAIRVAAGVSGGGGASASGSGLRSSKRARSTFMKVRVFKPRRKYLMLKRMERGLGPLDDAEDEEEAQAEAGQSAAGGGGGDGDQEWEREDGNPNAGQVSAWFDRISNGQSGVHSSGSLGLRQGAAEAVRRATAHQGVHGAGGSASGDEYDDRDTGSSPLSSPATRPSSLSTGARPCVGVTFAVGATVDAWCVVDEEGAPPSWQAATIVALSEDKAKVHFQQHYFAAKDAWLPRIASRIAPRGSMTVSGHDSSVYSSR